MLLVKQVVLFLFDSVFRGHESHLKFPALGLIWFSAHKIQVQQQYLSDSNLMLVGPGEQISEHCDSV